MFHSLLILIFISTAQFERIDRYDLIKICIKIKTFSIAKHWKWYKKDFFLFSLRFNFTLLVQGRKLPVTDRELLPFKYTIHKTRKCYQLKNVELLSSLESYIRIFKP